MEQTRLIIISRSEPKLFIFPKSKKERVSFTAYDMINEREINILTTGRVKNHLKTALKVNELWIIEGFYNSDKSTFYISYGFKYLDAKGSKELARSIIDYWSKEDAIQ